MAPAHLPAYRSLATALWRVSLATSVRTQIQHEDLNAADKEAHRQYLAIRHQILTRAGTEHPVFTQLIKDGAVHGAFAGAYCGRILGRSGINVVGSALSLAYALIARPLLQLGQHGVGAIGSALAMAQARIPRVVLQVGSHRMRAAGDALASAYASLPRQLLQHIEHCRQTLSDHLLPPVAWQDQAYIAIEEVAHHAAATAIAAAMAGGALLGVAVGLSVRIPVALVALRCLFATEELVIGFVNVLEANRFSDAYHERLLAAGRAIKKHIDSSDAAEVKGEIDRWLGVINGKNASVRDRLRAKIRQANADERKQIDLWREKENALREVFQQEFAKIRTFRTSWHEGHVRWLQQLGQLYNVPACEGLEELYNPFEYVTEMPKWTAPDWKEAEQPNEGGGPDGRRRVSYCQMAHAFRNRAGQYVWLRDFLFLPETKQRDYVGQQEQLRQSGQQYRWLLHTAEEVGKIESENKDNPELYIIYQIVSRIDDLI